MKIIHMADMHLGFRQYMSEKRLQDFANSFLFVQNYVTRTSPDLVVISGDVFHKKHPDYGSLALFKDFVNSCNRSNISIVGITGNHCHSRPTWREYFNISNTFENDVMTAVGVDWSESPMKAVKNLTAPNSNKFNMLLLHQGPVDKQGILSADDISYLNKTYSYIALGHIHKKYIIGNLYNPGSLEYTSSILWGDPGGFFDITLDLYGASISHIETPHRNVFKHTVNVEEGDTSSSIIRQVSSLVNNLTSDYMIEIHLTGDKRVSIEFTQKIEEYFSGFFRFTINNKSNNNSKPSIDYGNDEDITTNAVEAVFGDKAKKAKKIMDISSDSNAVIEEL